MPDYKVLTIPFARDALPDMVNDIPDAPSVPEPQLASWQQGFPYVTTIPLVAGGIPPEGQDFNGILRDITEHVVHQNKGGMYKFEADIVAAGGYPEGAVLAANDGLSLWVSLVDSNVEDFNTGTPTQWARIAFSGLDALLNTKADKAVSIKAGNGLTGGGALSADRTLSVSYGTTAGTAAQGNDSRLSNAREWTAETVSQAEAEAGTATTRRAWTAQRVAQAVRGTVLTGLSTASAAAVAASDSVLSALGKLQAQVTGLATSKLDATANAVSATKLQTARSIALAGNVTGSASFDGSANVSITATVANDSHTHDTRYPVLSAERVLANVPAGSWVTIAQVPSQGDRAYGEFIVYDVDRAKHNLVKIIASHSYGASTVACIGGNRYDIRTIARVRVLYSTADRIFGGAKLQVYIEDTCTLRVRALMINQINGWSAWSGMTPVVEGTPADWAEDTTTRYNDITNPGASFSGSFSGNATTATKLATARTINGVSFDGTANITLPNTDGTPAGAVMAFARSTAPDGWLKANGAAVSRTAYAGLFAAIGTTFGAGDGSTTFNLPDMRGEFLRGWDDARGVDSGRTFGSQQDSDNKSHTHTTSTKSYAHSHTWSGTTSNNGVHTHTVTGYNSGGVIGLSNQPATGVNNGSTPSVITVDSAGAHTHTVSGTTSSDSHTHTVTVNANGGTEARPRNLALLFCIKY